jgi:hypothetical protein
MRRPVSGRPLFDAREAKLRRFPMVLRLFLLAGLVFASVVVGAFAWNVQILWAILLVSLGILIGLVTIRGVGKIAGLICFLGLAAVPLIVAIRAMPIHSFGRSFGRSDLDGLDRIVIAMPDGEEHIEITEPSTVGEFKSLVGTGFYQSSLKCGECYEITFCRGLDRSRWVIKYDTFGHLRGGFCETVFVPQRRGDFRRWLENVLKAGGHSSRSVATDR